MLLLCFAGILLHGASYRGILTGPQVQKKADGREPEIICAHAHLYLAIIIKPGKQLIVVYPALRFLGKILRSPHPVSYYGTSPR
jgi:hypothetical protein